MISMVFLFACSSSSPKKRYKRRALSKQRSLANVDATPIPALYDENYGEDSVVIDIAHKKLGGCIPAFLDYKNSQALIDQGLIIPGRANVSFFYLAAEFQYSKDPRTEKKLEKIIQSLDKDLVNKLLSPKDLSRVKATHLVHTLKYCNLYAPSASEIYDLQDWINNRR